MRSPDLRSFSQREADEGRIPPARFDQSIRPDGKAHAGSAGLGGQDQFAPLLNAVERGETIVITRHGCAIARIVPEPEHRQFEIRAAIDGIKTLRGSGTNISADESGR